MKHFSPRKRALNFLRWLFIIAVYCVPFLAEAQDIFDLALEKDLADGQSQVVYNGDLVNYTISIFNDGNTPADNLSLIHI